MESSVEEQPIVQEYKPSIIEISNEEKSSIVKLPYLETTNSSSVIINPKTYKPPVQKDEPQEVQSTALTPSQIINETFEPYLRKIGKLIDHYENALHYSTENAGKSLDAKDCQEDLDMCYDKIPAIFFDDNFTLNDEPIYQIVLDPKENPKVIQYKLSGYLDIIEVCLMQQISVQSEKLFTAVKQIQAFQLGVAQTLKQIDLLRHHIREIDDKYVLSPLRIPTLVRRKENAKKVQILIDMMLNIKKLLVKAKKSLNKDDYDDCMKKLYLCQKLIRGDLSKIKSIKGFIEETEALKKRLISKLIMKFIVISLDLNKQSFNSTTSTKTERHHSKENDEEASDEADNESDDESSNKQHQPTMEEELAPIIQYLIRLRGLKSALYEYKQKTEQQLVELINTVVGTLLPTVKTSFSSSLSSTPFMVMQDTSSNSLNSLTINKSYDEFISLLSHKDFLFLLDLLCEKFLECSSRAKKVNAITSNVLLYIPINDDMNKNGMDILSVSKNEQADISQYSNTVYSNIWSLVQKHLGTLLEARSNLHKEMNINELNDVWTHTLDFVTVAGRLFGTRGKLLLSSLMKQIRSSLEYVHSMQMEGLKQVLQQETWKPTLISSDMQKQITLMVDKPDEATYILTSLIHNDMSAASPRLFVSTQYFCVSTSVVEFIKMIFVYILYAKSFQGLGTDVMYRIFDILKLYDNYTNNLILNAQAVILGYLKRITAKHIAIVSQSIGCIHALLPHIQAAIALYLPPLQHKILNELLQGIAQIYADHRQQLLYKLPEMICSIAERSLEDIPNIDWNIPAASPSPYMETLIKKTSTLYGQLAPILSEEHIHLIFTEILHSCSKLFMTQYSKLDIIHFNQIARDRVTADVNAFLSSIRSIPSLPDRGLELESSIRTLLYKDVPQTKIIVPTDMLQTDIPKDISNENQSNNDNTTPDTSIAENNQLMNIPLHDDMTTIDSSVIDPSIDTSVIDPSLSSSMNDTSFMDTNINEKISQEIQDVPSLDTSLNVDTTDVSIQENTISIPDNIPVENSDNNNIMNTSELDSVLNPKDIISSTSTINTIVTENSDPFENSTNMNSSVDNTQL